MSQIVLTIITWFILVSLFFHMQGYVRANHDMLNLVPTAPRLLKLVRVGPRLLKLTRAGRCLLNLVRADPLIIGRSGSGAALVRYGRGHGCYRRDYGGSLVCCTRGAGQECPFPIPLQGLVLHSALPKGNTCVSGTSSCVLVGSREPLHGCIGDDGHGYHHRQKRGQNPLSFLRQKGRAFAQPFYAFWFFVGQPRTIRKKAK